MDGSDQEGRKLRPHEAGLSLLFLLGSTPSGYFHLFPPVFSYGLGRAREFDYSGFVMWFYC
jgi:hypothetical protein